MTHAASLVRGVRTIGALLCLTLAAAPPATAGAPGIDGPGSYYMFRSFDTAAPFNTEQEQACADYYGPVRNATASDLNAALFAFSGDGVTGHVENQKASYLSAAIACTAPVVNPDLLAPDPDLLEIFGMAWPPPSVIAGLSTFDARCSPAPALGQPGALLVSCRGPFGPDPSGRVVGGVATSNTISNPRNAVPGAPTGSIWTTYVVAQRGVRLPPPGGGTPPPTPDPNPGLDFYVFRTSKDATAPSSPDCPGSPPGTVVGARRSALHATAPSHVDGQLPPRLGSRAGALTVCFTSSRPSRRTAVASIELSHRGRAIRLDASGDCADFPTPAGASLSQQACNLRVDPSPEQLVGGIRGGLLTSNGLVNAGNALTAANSHVWTLALFASTA